MYKFHAHKVFFACQSAGTQILAVRSTDQNLEKNFYFWSSTNFRLRLDKEAQGARYHSSYTEALLRMVTPGAGFRGATFYNVTPIMKIMSKIM